jgi:hypothetical protein
MIYFQKLETRWRKGLAWIKPTPQLAAYGEGYEVDLPEEERKQQGW